MWYKTRNMVSVLLVEDDDVDVMSFIRSFEKKKIGNPIVRARDGVEALEILRNNGVDNPFIVLLDLQMPRMSGHEFLKAIREDNDLKKCVVFVLTTSDAEQDIDECYRSNVAGYFVKDDAANQFLDVISLLDGYWKIAELPTVDGSV